VELDNLFGYIYYFMILIVVIFGIMNTILMAVMERYREFGVMMALGTRPEKIVWLILSESAMIALVGIVIGDILGFCVSYYFTQVPMDFSAYSKSVEAFGINPLLYARIYPFVFYVTDLIILGATILSAVYPAVKASRLSPVRALRYV
jgi:putative ABC transport system permease protein